MLNDTNKIQTVEHYMIKDLASLTDTSQESKGWGANLEMKGNLKTSITCTVWTLGPISNKL